MHHHMRMAVLLATAVVAATLTVTQATDASSESAACADALLAELSFSSPASLAMVLGASGLNIPGSLGSTDTCDAIADAHLCVLSGVGILPFPNVDADVDVDADADADADADIRIPAQASTPAARNFAANYAPAHHFAALFNRFSSLDSLGSLGSLGTAAVANGSLALPLNNGLCVPAVCSGPVLAELLGSGGVPGLGFSGSIHCVDEAPKQWSTLFSDAGATAVVAAVGVLAVLVVVASVLDVVLAAAESEFSEGAELGYPDPYHGGVQSLFSGSFGLTAPSNPGVHSRSIKAPLLSGGVSALGLVPGRDRASGGDNASDEPDRHPLRVWLPTKVLLAWSAVHNTRRLCAHPPPLLNVLNGIRVISMALIILGHTVYIGVLTAGVANPTVPYGTSLLAQFGLSDTDINASKGAVFRPPFQLIVGAEFCVDTFFALSGFLVVFLTLKTLARGKPVSWPMFLLHRFLRLTPTIGFMLAVYIKVAPFMGRGPMWHQLGSMIDETCNKNSHWLSPLGYINAFVPAKYIDQCAGWLWYTSCDMLLFLLTPAVILAFRKSFAVGAGLVAALSIASMVGAAVLASHNDLTVYISSKPGSGDYSTEYYGKPYFRLPPYMLGAGLGGLLDYCGHRMGYVPRLPLLARWTVYAVAGFLLISTYFGQTSEYAADKPYGGWDKSTKVAYLALSRSGWAVGLLMVVYVFVSGDGGPVAKLLASRPFSALSRATFGAYVWHPVIMLIVYSSRSRLGEYSAQFFAVHFGFFLVAAYAASFASYLLVEKPLMNLEAMLFGIGK